jgi:hypothetical protein
VGLQSLELILSYCSWQAYDESGSSDEAEHHDPFTMLVRQSGRFQGPLKDSDDDVELIYRVLRRLGKNGR